MLTRASIPRVKSMLSETDHIERPSCPKCSTGTKIMRRSPYAPGMELRLFECPQCGEVVQQVVKESDPPVKNSGGLGGA